MDPKRFDHWTRNLARRLSRRDALRLAGAGGVTAALASTALPALAQTTCSLQIHGETVAGPSAPQTYEGVLAFTTGEDGVFTKAVYTPEGRKGRSAAGRATGRAIDFHFTLGDNKFLAFSGAAEQAIESCQGVAAGTFSGPQPGDLGGWQATAGAIAPTDATNGQPATTGAAPAAPTPTPPPSQDTTQPPAQNQPGNSCLELHSQCNQSSECCSGWCADNECRSCGDTVCGEDCIVLSDNLAHCGACFNACDTDTQTCVDGVCTAGDNGGCLPDGGSCTFPDQCCSGHCPRGRNVCGCSQIGEICGATGDCCQPANGALIGCVGGNNDICVGLQGVPCQANSDCLSQNCVNGFC
jgi:hypothetical protein